MIIMTVFVVITLILSFTRYRVMTAADEKAEDETGNRWRDMWVVIAILFLWVLLLRYAGFALTGVTGFAIIAWYISGQRKDWRVMAKAVVLGLAITYLIILFSVTCCRFPCPKAISSADGDSDHHQSLPFLGIPNRVKMRMVVGYTVGY